MLKKIASVRRNKIISCNLKKEFQFHKINYARFTNAEIFCNYQNENFNIYVPLPLT